MIAALVDFDYRFKNGLLRLLTRRLFRPPDPARVRRVLVLRVGALGDGVCALPALAAIRANFTTARIDLLTRTGGENRVSLGDLVSPNVVDEVIPFQKTAALRLAKQLRLGRYDLFIELSQSHARFGNQLLHLLWARWVGFPAAFGWEVTATRWFRRFQEQSRPFPDERTRLLAMLAARGLRVPRTQRFPLAIRTADEIAVAERLARYGLGDATRNIALVIGASRPQNRWPIRNFDRVSCWLLEQGFRVLIVGGPEDVPLAAQLTAHPHLHDCTGRLTPVQSAVLLRNCRCCVTNDTGTLHLAYTVGTPVVALFSARDYPGLWFPPVGNHHVLRTENVPCGVCLSARCRDNVCLRAIHPERVITVLKTVLPTLSIQQNAWC